MNSSIQVLVIDDDCKLNNEQVRVLKESGITSCVKTALNGGHGMLLLNQFYQDLRDNKLIILLDTKMPIMGGIEFLYNFEKSDFPHKQNTEIILMVSSETSVEDMDEARNLGVTHFVSKPISPSAIRKILGNKPDKMEKVA